MDIWRRDLDVSMGTPSSGQDLQKRCPAHIYDAHSPAHSPRITFYVTLGPEALWGGFGGGAQGALVRDKVTFEAGGPIILWAGRAPGTPGVMRGGAEAQSRL